MKKLIEITAFLRSEDGCEWDKKQNFKSMISHLIEEAYEVVDAIETEDFENLKEELGDLLFHIVFQARLAEESGLFNFEDIAENISNKLIRRHPHIFDKKVNLTSTDVLKNWEIIKRNEKKGNKSILDDIPRSFGPLLRAEKMQEKVANIGFDFEKIEDVESKLREEIDEFLIELNNKTIEKENTEKIEEEFGDVLFSLINLSRHLNISIERALNKTLMKFSNRFKYMEDQARNAGKEISELSLVEMDKLWEESKNSFS